MKHTASINEFFVEGKKQKKSHVLLHITEPTTKEEWKRGYFFALCEIEHGDLELIGHAQRLIDDIESGYYETEVQSHEKSPFELTLEFINRRSNHLLHANGKLHCLVGVLNDTSLSLSYHGNPHAQVFFLQHDQYKSIDILEGDDQHTQEHIFSAVIEGQLNVGDTLFLGTPHITNEISLERIQNILMSRPLDQAVSHIQHVLQDAKNDESYGGLVCTIRKKDTVADPSTSNSAASLQHLIERERETTETLSPTLFGKKKKKHAVQKTKRHHTRRNAIETNHRRRADEIIGGSFVNMILVGIGKGLVSVMTSLWHGLKYTGIVIGRFCIIMFILITNKNNSRAHTIRSLKETGNQLTQHIRQLSFVSKLLLLGVISLSIVFSASMAFLRMQEHYAQKEAAYLAQVSAITDKHAAAEARKIYNDDASAFALLKEAEKMLSTLPQDTDEQAGQFSELQLKIETALLDLRDITVVEPKRVADLNTMGEGVQISKLVRIDDSLVAFGPDDARLYIVDKDTGTVETQAHDSLAKLFAGNTPKEHDNIVFLGEGNTVYTYNKETNAISNTAISYPSDEVDVTAPFVYNLRLYMVDQANNQIIRHSKTQGGYDRGTPWLNDGITPDLSDVVSSAIDGDIFVLKQNGEILKFAGGEQQLFETTGLDPVLNNPTELYTYNDVDGIYILEPTHKRVVVLNKQGTFRAQYTSDVWQHPTSMVVDEAKKTIYVLDSNVVYSFTL